MSDRKRQQYTTGFKAEAVRLLVEGGSECDCMVG